MNAMTVTAVEVRDCDGSVIGQWRRRKSVDDGVDRG